MISDFSVHCYRPKYFPLQSYLSIVKKILVVIAPPKPQVISKQVYSTASLGQEDPMISLKFNINPAKITSRAINFH